MEKEGKKEQMEFYVGKLSTMEELLIKRSGEVSEPKSSGVLRDSANVLWAVRCLLVEAAEDIATPAIKGRTAVRTVAEVIQVTENGRLAAFDRATTAKNSKKPHWRLEKSAFLFRKLNEEVGEVGEAMLTGGLNHAEAMNELADVIWTAMMLRDSLSVGGRS